MDSITLLGIDEVTVDDVVDVEFSNQYLLQPDPCDDGDWLLLSLMPFDSEETLTLTLSNGQTVEIGVTDAYVGAPGGAGHTDFASAMDLSTISIADLRRWPDTEITANGLKLMDSTRYAWNGTLAKNEIKSLGDGVNLSIRYKKAATTADGQVCDVVVRFSDIVLYGDTRGAMNNKKFAVAVAASGTTVASSSGLPGVTGYAMPNDSTSYRYGLEEKVTIYI